MKGFNKVQLLGHVGKDPDIRSTVVGAIVANFSLATADRHKDKAGNWVDKTEWHTVTAFGRTAELIRDYVKKGSQLFIEGKLQTTSWEDKETGQKRYRTDVLVDDLIFLSSPRTEASNGAVKAADTTGKRAPRRGRDPAADEYAYTHSDHSLGITDDDIPF